jgi:hypothetical protein
MLRTTLLVFAVLLTLAGLACLLTGAGPATPMTVWGSILLAAVLLERWRYQQHGHADGEWQETGERFVDPETGQATRVLYHPRSGERRYEPLDAKADS